MIIFLLGVFAFASYASAPQEILIFEPADKNSVCFFKELTVNERNNLKKSGYQESNKYLIGRKDSQEKAEEVYLCEFNLAQKKMVGPDIFNHKVARLTFLNTNVSEAGLIQLYCDGDTEKLDQNLARMLDKKIFQEPDAAIVRLQEFNRG